MNANTVILKGSVLRKEGIAGGAVRPGAFLIFSTGKLIEHATAAAAVLPQIMVAVEEDFMGEDPLDNYALDDQLQYVVPQRGAEINAWLKTANNVAVGAALEMGGAGNLQARSTGAVVAYAMEAVNNASGVDARIRVEIV